MPKTKKEKVDPKQIEKELKAISKEEGGLAVKEDSKNKKKDSIRSRSFLFILFYISSILIYLLNNFKIKEYTKL